MSKGDYMKNILIIRSANMETMDKLIKYIKEANKNINYKIYCLIQRGSIKVFQEKYAFIDYIEKEDGFFEYKAFINNKELVKKLNICHFEEVYIPSSYIDYPNFHHTFMIVSKINSKKYILFNKDGEAQEQKFNFYLLWIDKYLSEVIYFIKVLFALVGIFIIYVFGYSYYFIKRKLLKRI
ncbi:hypothetical protein [Clostridium botulinum]|uniref:hypothetical protein n=1 Tax=Clostridium botulinum TaxID=1491 RepID=UPI001FA92177|nr:hypothetical protein [Clostridium botulinum]